MGAKLFAVILAATPWTASADDERCFRCAGKYGEKVFGDCEASGGTRLEVPCTAEEIAFRAKIMAQHEEWVASQQPAPREPLPTLGVTMAGYNRLHDGMRYEDAVDVLGSPGEEVSSSRVGTTSTRMYSWSAARGIGNMNAMFQNGRLVSKAQFGLD